MGSAKNPRAAEPPAWDDTTWFTQELENILAFLKECLEWKGVQARKLELKTDDIML